MLAIIIAAAGFMGPPPPICERAEPIRQSAAFMCDRASRLVKDAESYCAAAEAVLRKVADGEEPNGLVALSALNRCDKLRSDASVSQKDCAFMREAVARLDAVCQ